MPKGIDEIIEVLEEAISLGDDSPPDSTHWGLEEGVLLTLNDAKLILYHLKQIKAE